MSQTVFDQYAPSLVRRGSHLGFQSSVYQSITHDSEHAPKATQPAFTSIEREQGFNSDTNEKDCHDGAKLKSEQSTKALISAHKDRKYGSRKKQWDNLQIHTIEFVGVHFPVIVNQNA